MVVAGCWVSTKCQLFSAPNYSSNKHFPPSKARLFDSNGHKGDKLQSNKAITPWFPLDLLVRFQSRDSKTTPRQTWQICVKKKNHSHMDISRNKCWKVNIKPLLEIIILEISCLRITPPLLMTILSSTSFFKKLKLIMLHSSVFCRFVITWSCCYNFIRNCFVFSFLVYVDVIWLQYLVALL